MGDRDEKPALLQRRGGRRISIPSSPISPSILKRSDKFLRSPEPVVSNDVAVVTDASAEHPVIDLTFPSPVLDGPTFGPLPDISDRTALKSVHDVVTEDGGKRRSLEQPEILRALSSTGRFYEGRQTSLRPAYSSDMTTKSSPTVGRSLELRDRAFDTPISSIRNYSTTSLSTDRSASDENVSSKATVAKKSRLNMLNPMSLLARRRSSQNARLEDMNISISPLQVPAIPDNFEPSIRGSFVHDFSTPRSKKSHFDGSPRREAFSSPANLRRPSDIGSPASQHVSSPVPTLHSPMFKEHFQDEDRSLQPGQTAYLHSIVNSRKLLEPTSAANLPSFAPKLPTIPTETSRSNDSRKALHIEIPHPEAPPPPPPPKRTPSPKFDLLFPTAVPKHMTSVSSRFSFQIAGQDSSAQEKLLEEKHKEHFSQKASKSASLRDTSNDPEYEDYDFDADDDLEEKIPGVNTDYDDDDGFDNDDIPIRNIDTLSSQSQVALPQHNFQGFHFTPTSTAFSPLSPNPESQLTPRDQQGFPIGVADTHYSPVVINSVHASKGLEDDVDSALYFEGLRISTGEHSLVPQPEATPPPDISQEAFNDTDLYFDDGEFDIDEAVTDAQFDESLLDDDSHVIRDIPAENAKRYEAALERSAPGDFITTVDPQSSALSRDTSSSSQFVNIRGGESPGFPINSDHEAGHSAIGLPSVLTEDNLAAYHDALAEAANYAAANGKFNRQVSFRSDLSEESDRPHISQRQIGLISHESRSQNDLDSVNMDDYETFPFDYDDEHGEDDLMIAEANAEALENDEEGFYGQEFGFYARAHGKDATDLVNGGFFAAHGSNGIKRSHSGKAAFQEPSLTPITERSEWSARNSVASLQFPGGLSGVQPSFPSPGLSQLLDSSSFEDEMSLSALMKLRRGAFGGSSTSVNSLGDRSMPGSSPLAHVSSYSFPPPEGSHLGKHVPMKPGSIMESEEDEDENEAGQLTLTQNTPRKPASGPSVGITQNTMVHLSVTDSPSANRRPFHRRSSSGAESVSYVRDKDGQWVLERRRTAEDGAQEIVEREYLVGARI